MSDSDDSADTMPNIVNSFVEDLLKFVKAPRGEDFVDKLNCRTTSIALFLSAILCLARDMFGKPVQCWGNAEWKKGWVEYSHDYCYVENTYYIPMQQKGVPINRTELIREQEISYYQWVPFILIIQGLMFVAPLLVWRFFDVAVSGIHVQAILDMARDANMQVTRMERDVRRSMAKQMNEALVGKMGDSQRRLHGLRRFFSQCSLAFIYCLTKVLFIGNAFLQFYLLGRFLGKSSHIWGFSTLDALRRGESWIDTGLFPRVTMCDLAVRQAGGGHTQRYTVQCVLSGNMVNEKIFVLLWWWLIFLCGITIANLVHWLYGLVFFNSSSLQKFKHKLMLSAGLVWPEPGMKRKDEYEDDCFFNDNGNKSSEYEEEDESETEYETEVEDEKEDKSQASKDSATKEGDTNATESTAATDDTTTKEGSEEPKKEGEEPKKEGEEADDNSKMVVVDVQKKKKADKKKKVKKPKRSLLERRHDAWDQKYKAFKVKIENEFEDFYEFLGTDGILMLELIEINSSPMVASNVLGRMFLSFKPGSTKQWAEDDVMLPNGTIGPRHRHLANGRIHPAGGDNNIHHRGSKDKKQQGAYDPFDYEKQLPLEDNYEDFTHANPFPHSGFYYSNQNGVGGGSPL